MFIAVAIPTFVPVLCVLLLLVAIAGMGEAISGICAFLLGISWVGLLVGAVLVLVQNFILCARSEAEDAARSAVAIIASFVPDALCAIGMGQIIYALLVMFGYADFHDLLTIISAVPAMLLCFIMIAIAALFYAGLEALYYFPAKYALGEMSSTHGASVAIVALNVVKLVLAIIFVALCQRLSMEIIEPGSGFYEYVLVGPIAQINNICYESVCSILPILRF